jgi:nucleotidyltransferase/DNA polymerase involved in DNA repair
VKAMHEKQQVAEMATEVLRRQARARIEQTGEPFEGALKAVLDTKAGGQLGELRNGPHCDETAERWQEDLAPERAKERRSQARQEELDRARLVAWESFMRAERRELELRKAGQLARLLGEPLPGEPPEAMLRLASKDQRQAQQGLVALMSSGKVFYKHVEELSEEDMPARIAANRARTTWLKERQDRWLGRGWDYL